ncbi:MAG: glycoside hydrolase family protein [Bacteroidales bacterium]|nr:glycoside hydrolase family protein [Bacteroidales bacterium]
MKKLFSSFLLSLAVTGFAQEAYTSLPDGDYIIKVERLTDQPIRKEVIKKGAAVSRNTWTDPAKKMWYERNRSINVGWYYTWGPEWDEGNDFLSLEEFAPMIWGTSKADTTTSIGIAAKKTIEWEIANKKVNYLLGFNEPNGASQADMTPQEAIDYWPYLMSFNIPLGSPAPAGIMKGNSGAIWMDEFMSLVKEKNYRVDFLCMHMYPSKAENFKALVDSVWNRYGLPIWITEFCLNDPAATETVPNKFTQDDVIAFMADVLPWLDSKPYVKRYSWFGAPPANKYGLTSSQLFDPQTGELTRVGQYYANHKSVLEGQYYRK